MPFRDKHEMVRHFHVRMRLLPMQGDPKSTHQPGQQDFQLHGCHVLTGTRAWTLAPDQHHVLQLGGPRVDGAVGVDPAARVELVRIGKVGWVALCRVGLHRYEGLDAMEGC